MRVLYVIDSLITGGAERSLAAVAAGYRDVGIELHVAFLRDHWDVAAALESTGTDLHPVALGAGRVTQVRGLAALMRELDPDVVHTTLYEADVLGRAAAAIVRVPSVSTFASGAYSADHYANPSVRRSKLAAAQAVDAATARLARRFHAVSRPVADHMSRRLGLPRSSIEVIPRARDRRMLGEPSAERRQRVRSELDVGDEQPVILCVARHEFEKGLDIGIRAVAEVRQSHPDALLLVAGRDSRETPALHAAITELGLQRNVQLLGRRDDVPDLIVAADAVLVPSRTEGFPGAVLEAMALERPLIASDLPEVREAIGEFAAGLCEVGDYVGIGDAIEEVLTNPVQAFDRVAKARKRFDALYLPEPVADRMLQFYEAALRL